ncbi:hypothetical protein M2153_005096 [Pseudomonas sp. JUb96]|nr:hypothetical protein [Pseudomonas sp. JUb96]
MSKASADGLNETNRRIDELQARLTTESSLRLAYEAILTARIAALDEQQRLA